MTIALRFIPTLIKETDKIMSAQTARGANFTSGGLISRAKALIPVLIPLFISSFRRADELATAMECRCYHGGSGRTKMNVSKISTYDVLTTLAFILIGAAIILLNQITIGGF
jgi:energy-coupling factor transport system permease protein